MPPDPTLPTADSLADALPRPAWTRADWVLAGTVAAIAMATLLVQFGSRRGVAVTGRIEPLPVAQATPYRVDVNAADWPEWMQLPGIGETRARDIVRYRAEHGPFRTLDDLIAVPGIGPKTLAKFRGELTLAAPPSVAAADASGRTSQSN